MIQRKKSLLEAALNGIRCKCPNCGRGRLFRAYLKPVDSCEACGMEWSEVRADDGPAWLTILLVGHVVVPVVILLTANQWMPDWANISLSILLAGLLTFVFLPVAKGIFIAAIWTLGAETS